MEAVLIFFGVIVVGIMVFFVIFLKEKKFDAAEDQVSLNLRGNLRGSNTIDIVRGLPLVKSGDVETPFPDAGALHQAPLASPVEASLGEPEGVKEILFNKLDEKCSKLELILQEKNKSLARLEEDLKREKSMRGEFDSLRNILQEQIDDLKEQNKLLRDDLSESLKDNLDVQTKLGRSLEQKSGDSVPYVTAEPATDGNDKRGPEEETLAEPSTPILEPLPGPLSNEKVIDDDVLKQEASQDVSVMHRLGLGDALIKDSLGIEDDKPIEFIEDSQEEEKNEKS